MCLNEDDAGPFERVLNRFDGDCLQFAPALEPRHRVPTHLGREGELTHAPSESRSRDPTLNWEDWSHIVTNASAAAAAYPNIDATALPE